MKKTLLYILAAFALIACKPTPQQIAEDYLYSIAYHPEHLKVLSCNTVHRPDTTIVSTSYHISAVDGDPDGGRYWKNVTAVYTDSVRISHTHLPEHYYCCATIECMSDCENIVRETVEMAVLPNDSAIMFDTYRKRYYNQVIDTTYAQCDTLTNVRECIGYLPEWNGWVVKQMLLDYNLSSARNSKQRGNNGETF